MRKQGFSSSISNAFKGIYLGIAKHRNIKIMLAIAAVVVAAGRYYELVRYEWAIVWVCIGMVLGMEMLNTAIEELLDHLHPERHPNIGKAKDIAAGAVLITSMAAGIAGIYIFLPRIFY